jgi:hypothetical protein
MSFILLIFALGSAAGFVTSPNGFAQWMLLHGRQYTGTERAVRYEHFKVNAAEVAAVARASPLAKYQLDDFADWSPAEFKIQRPSNPLSSMYAGAEEQIPFSDELVRAAADKPIDWVAKGAVTPAISQGRCGTCAQFSATGDIEAQVSSFCQVMPRHEMITRARFLPVAPCWPPFGSTRCARDD